MSKVSPEREDIAALLDKVPLTSLETSAPKETVCVTGATGYVGAHVVRRLLRIGHTVHAPIRNPDDKKKVDGLMTMPGAPELLTVYKADLMEAGSYDEAMVGCSTVIHVASPWFMVGNKKFVKENLLDPALTGTENIMASCSRTPTVKKVRLFCLRTLIANSRALIVNPRPPKLNTARCYGYDMDCMCGLSTVQTATRLCGQRRDKGGGLL